MFFGNWFLYNICGFKSSEFLQVGQILWPLKVKLKRKRKGETILPQLNWHSSSFLIGNKMTFPVLVKEVWAPKFYRSGIPYKVLVRMVGASTKLLSHAFAFEQSKALERRSSLIENWLIRFYSSCWLIAWNDLITKSVKHFNSLEAIFWPSSNKSQLKFLH